MNKGVLKQLPPLVLDDDDPPELDEEELQGVFVAHVFPGDKS